MDPGSAARRAIGAAAVLGSGMGEVKDSDLGPGFGLVVVGEESWGAAGGGVAGLGLGGDAAGGEGGGLAAAGPGRGGGDAVRRMRSASAVKQTNVAVTWRAAVQEQTNEGADEARYKKGTMKLKLRGRDAGQGSSGDDARRCARRRCSLGEEQGLERDRTVGFSYRTGRAG